MLQRQAGKHIIRLQARLYALAVLICVLVTAGSAYSEKLKSINKFGISFNCPEGCRIEEEVAVGHYDRIHCTSDMAISSPSPPSRTMPLQI